MKKAILNLFLIVSVSFLFGTSEGKPAYKLFNSEGKDIFFEEMMTELITADMVFFGELHDNPIAHWLELEVTKACFQEVGEKLVLGAEMFEADNQLLLDEYLQGMISEKSFENEIRLWSNYETDYKPLVEFAKTNNLDFIASNIPRRYASVVSKIGFEGLAELEPEARKYIAPLPIIYDPEVECYKKMLEMGNMPGAMMDKNNFPKAQAIKDATMSYFILENWQTGKLFLHFNGSYHSDNYEGIVWYLLKEKPELKIKTITTILQEKLGTPAGEELEKADFIIAVPEAMTRSY